jgi:hypothetical protein
VQRLEPDPFVNALAAEPQFPDDVSRRASGCEHRSELREHGQLGGTSRRSGDLLLVPHLLMSAGDAWRGEVVAGGGPDRASDVAQLLLDGFAEVLQQMKTIGNLPSLRCAMPCRFCVEAAAIAANDLDPGVCRQPFSGTGG